MLFVRVDRGKQLIDIAMPLDDIDDLKTFVGVPEKDDVSFERRAAYIEAQFRPCSAEGADRPVSGIFAEVLPQTDVPPSNYRSVE